MSVEVIVGILAILVISYIAYRLIKFALFIGTSVLVLYLIASYYIINVGIDWTQADKYNINLKEAGFDLVRDLGDGDRLVVFSNELKIHTLKDPAMTYIYAMNDSEREEFNKDKGAFIKNIEEPSIFSILKLDPMKTAKILYQAKGLIFKGLSSEESVAESAESIEEIKSILGNEIKGILGDKVKKHISPEKTDSTETKPEDSSKESASSSNDNDESDRASKIKLLIEELKKAEVDYHK